MYSQEKQIALEFVNKHKSNPAIKIMAQEVVDMSYASHSDRWSYVYDTIYDEFNRNEVPREVVTGLTYLIEECGTQFLN